MIRTILFVLIGILALSFFGISLRSIVESPVGQQNIQYVWQLVQEGWNAIVAVFTPLLAHHV